MVDRISISTNRIITRDSSNNVTFDTNSKYFKTVTNGNYEVGGLARGPCLVGYGRENNDQFFDYHQNKGFTCLMSRSGVTLVPGASFNMEFFVPSHNMPSALYQATLNTYFIGQINGGGTRVPRPVISNTTYTNFGATTSNVVTLYRRESTSDSWASIDTGKVQRQRAQYTYDGFSITNDYYLLDVDVVQAAVSGRSTSYYYKILLPNTWNNTMQYAGTAVNYGTLSYWMYTPSVGRAPEELDLAVTP